MVRQFRSATGGQMDCVIAPRLSSRVGFPPIGEVWKDTAIELPETLSLEKAHDLFTCRPLHLRDRQ